MTNGTLVSGPERWRHLARVAVLGLVLAQLAYVFATFPSLEDYYPGADEGIYFRQAAAIVDGGLPAFRSLGREFLADPRLQAMPPPTRMGHLLVAAAAIRVNRSFRALSIESWIAFALLCGAVFLFVTRLWGEAAALPAVLLTATAPLTAGLARRALSDADHTLFAVVTVFLFLEWAARPRDRTFAWFLAAMAWTASIKETIWFLLPAFVIAMAFMRLRGIGGVKARHLLLLAVVPLAGTVVCTIAFGGPGQAAAIVSAIRRANALESSLYLHEYHAGPWSSGFVAMFLLAPLTTLAFLLSCGWWIDRLRRAPLMSVTLVWSAAAFACMAMLPQNPRYALPLDVMVRTIVAVTLATAFLASASRRRWTAAAAIVLVLAASGVVSFRRLFVEDGIYDPTDYNLLAATHVIPGAPVFHRPRTDTAYLDLSLAYYQVRDFRASIAAAERAIALRPDSAEAYNNLGASYCELGLWREAIEALEHAVALRPNFPMAHNNLAWARAGLQKQGG